MRDHLVLAPGVAELPSSPARLSMARMSDGVVHLGSFRVRLAAMPVVLCAVILALTWTGCWFLPDVIARASPTGLCPSADARVFPILPH